MTQIDPILFDRNFALDLADLNKSASLSVLHFCRKSLVRFVSFVIESTIIFFIIFYLFYSIVPLGASENDCISDCADEVFSLYNMIYGVFPISPDDLAQLASPSYETIKETKKSYYGEFTLLSENQIHNTKTLTENPGWTNGSREKVEHYYALHQETQFDKNLRTIATTLVKVIIHGDLDQKKLSTHLNQFNIRKLLSEGPHPSFLLSSQAQRLIYDSLHSIDRVYDIHLHNLGYDEGNYLNPKTSSLRLASWKNYFSFLVLRYAAGMSSPKGSTHEARKRMHLYAGHFPKLRGMVLPIHKAISPDHSEDWENTGNFLTNQSALLTAISFENSDSELLPAISIHPFDPRWKQQMIQARKKGIRLIKWMPPQSIPPNSDLLNGYYKKMKELGMILIAHAGPEHTIPTTEGNKKWQDWGNPLRFRKPLQLGVDVILAHCGHKEKISDLDHPENIETPGYKLFIRLAQEAHQKNQSGEWKGKLYGDLAAVPTHYGPEFVAELLKYANEEGIRFIYASDYPFTNLIQPRKDAYEAFANYGLLDPEKIGPLKEIRAWNPLLANYVFTRNIALKKENGEKIQFPESTFTCEFKGEELRLIDQERWEYYKSHPS